MLHSRNMHGLESIENCALLAILEPEINISLQSIVNDLTSSAILSALFVCN